MTTKSTHDEEAFWPRDANVGQIVYPPGSTFGPRHQYALQLVLVHTGHMTVTIDGHAHRGEKQTVFILFPGHEECFTFAEQCETRHSWLHILAHAIPPRIISRLE